MKTERERNYESHGKMINRLAATAKAGNKDALETIAMTYRPLVLSMVQKYVYDPDDRNDAYHDGMVALIKAVYDYDDIDKTIYFGVYLKQALFYCMMERTRRKKINTVSLDSPTSTDDNDSQCLGDTICDPKRGVEEALAEHDERRIIFSHIADLTERQRQVIYCRYVQGMSIATTAKRLNISKNTVGVLHSRAIKRLQQMV